MTPGRAVWQRIWHTSIKNRLTFLFFTITAGAIMVLYFYVVPQLESKLTSQKIDALERDSATYSRPFEDAIAREVTAAQLDSLTSALSDQTGARVTLLDIPVDELDPDNLEVLAALRRLRLEPRGRQAAAVDRPGAGGIPLRERS